MSVLQDFEKDFEKEIASGASDNKVDLAQELSRNTRFFAALEGLDILSKFGVDLTSIDDEKLQDIRGWLEENKEPIYWCERVDEQGSYPVGLPELSHRSTELVGTILPELLGLDEHSVV